MRYTKTDKRTGFLKQLNTVENITILKLLPIWHRRTSVRLYKNSEDTRSVHKKPSTTR